MFLVFKTSTIQWNQHFVNSREEQKKKKDKTVWKSKGRIINCWKWVYLCAGYDGKKFYKLVFTTYHAGEEGKINTDTNINTKCDWDRSCSHESSCPRPVTAGGMCYCLIWQVCVSVFGTVNYSRSVQESLLFPFRYEYLSGFKTSSELNSCNTAQNFQNLRATRNFEMPEGWHEASSGSKNVSDTLQNLVARGGLSPGICVPLYLDMAVWISVLVHWRWK